MIFIPWQFALGLAALCFLILCTGVIVEAIIMNRNPLKSLLEYLEYLFRS